MNASFVESAKIENELNYYQVKLIPYAYNILGEYMEAEDVVQEVLNRFFLNDTSHIDNPFNYLLRSVINRSINQKKRLVKRNMNYPGNWLPVPVMTEDQIIAHADSRQLLNYSLLVLLEQLKPKERAVFILRETFSISHDEIAGILDISADNSRQLLRRAKQKINPEVLNMAGAEKENRIIIDRLTEAIGQADIDKVKDLLSSEIRSISDGGPKVTAARNVVTGAKNTAKLLYALYNKYLKKNTVVRYESVCNTPALLFSVNGIVYRIVVFDIADDLIKAVYIVLNPDKLMKINSRK